MYQKYLWLEPSLKLNDDFQKKSKILRLKPFKTLNVDISWKILTPKGVDIPNQSTLTLEKQ